MTPTTSPQERYQPISGAAYAAGRLGNMSENASAESSCDGGVGRVGGSGSRHGGRNRTGEERLTAIVGAVRQGEEFRARVRWAEGDRVRCADLMAEAIEMNRAARGYESIGRDGRTMMCMEEMQSFYCMDAARDAYLRARGSNSLNQTPSAQERTAPSTTTCRATVRKARTVHERVP